MIKKIISIVIGDFNIDMLNRRYYADKLDNLFVTRGMMHSVNKPTRTTTTSSTLIDLVYANLELTTNVEDTPKVSDHAWISIEFEQINNENKKKITKRNFTNFTDFEFVHILRQNFYNNLFPNLFSNLFVDDNEERNIYLNLNDQANLNYKANNLIYSIESTLDLLAPVEEFFVNDKDKKWFTPEVKSQIKKRDHFF